QPELESAPELAAALPRAKAGKLLTAMSVDRFVVQYGCEFIHGSLLAVRQDVSRQVTSRRTAVAFDCDCRQAWRV
ncbi:MAG: hypothetical protein EOQ38_31470, partial [Mesorhizobium sp.]